MSVPVEVLTSAPISTIVVVAALRYGLAALLTLIAGLVAISTRDSERGERALRVLRLAASTRDLRRSNLLRTRSTRRRKG